MSKISQLTVAIYNHSERLVNLGNGDIAWYLLPKENCERFTLTTYHESFLSIQTQMGIFDLNIVGNFLQIVRALARKHADGQWQHSVEKARCDLEGATKASILIDSDGALHLGLDYEIPNILLRVAQKQF